MTFVAEKSGNSGLRLRLESPQPVLVDEQGILVVRAQPVGDLEGTVRREREGRLQSLLEQLGE
jgi:hypothetical protein